MVKYLEILLTLDNLYVPHIGQHQPSEKQQKDSQYSFWQIQDQSEGMDHTYKNCWNISHLLSIIADNEFLTKKSICLIKKDRNGDF